MSAKLFMFFFIFGTVINLTGTTPFFNDGKTAWEIYLSPQADQTEKYAAEELRNTLNKISGADFKINFGGKIPEANAIIIGDLKNPVIQSKATLLKLSYGETEKVAVYTLDNCLYLAGNQPRGALYAVYSFLQNELGVRWLWPGSDGEFIPVKERWSLPELKFNYKPSIKYRGFHLCGAWRDVHNFKKWMTRNFINIHRHAANPKDIKTGLHSMYSSHNARLSPSLFKQHPEYFAEVSGKHYQENICFSNPAVDKIVAAKMSEYIRKHPYVEILSVFPADNQTYCRCKKCAKMDISTAWFEFYNRLTNTLKKEFPKLKFSTIAYQGYLKVPKCQIQNSAFVEVATYPRCNIHPFHFPGCKRNTNIMEILHQWKKTGLPIGNYAYEYDIFSKNSRFVPFLGMIDDAIKTSKKLGHISIITEVPLSPKEGPVEYVNNVQNRLSLYIYAQLLWNPDLKMTDILLDWCQTAYGNAGRPMYEYFLTMNRDWNDLPVHATILGNALNVVPNFFTDKLKQKTDTLFAEADQALSKINNKVFQKRVVNAIEREKTLFKQWQDLAILKSGKFPMLNLPLLQKAEDFPKSASNAVKLQSPEPAASNHPALVRAAWTRNALLAKLAVQGKDSQKDKLELVLSSGKPNGKSWHFIMTPQGDRQAYCDLPNNPEKNRQKLDWIVKTEIDSGNWTSEMIIPFDSLGVYPIIDDIWPANFKFNGKCLVSATGKRSDNDGKILLFFNSTEKTDNSLIWWQGKPESTNKTGALKQMFTQAGWLLNFATTKDELLDFDGNIFWFQHPNGPNKVSVDCWKNKLRSKIKNGALAVFSSYWNVPLDQYFDDPSFKVKVVSCGKIPLAERHSKYIAPGDWSTKPNKLLRRLKRAFTPAYGFIPAEPDKWTILATAPRSKNKTYPYILARPYGAGMIILCGERISIPAVKLLENFIQYHKDKTNPN